MFSFPCKLYLLIYYIKLNFKLQNNNYSIKKYVKLIFYIFLGSNHPYIIRLKINKIMKDNFKKNAYATIN